ncbi:hypothetical protein [Archangium sp.]|jgi:hypothetical protein|uniref:hypothetical protein n=1 Tax=Archangium sp. TaxID=1872627 RepID=UPI002EDAD097
MTDAPTEGLPEYLDEEPRVRSLSDWIWGLSRWGKPVLVRAALVLAETCLETWTRGVPEDESWQQHYASSPLPAEALRTLRAWLEREAEPGDPELEACARALRGLVHAAEFYQYDASGSAELDAMRVRAVAAGRASQMALEAATWTEALATEGLSDEDERQARASAGPAPEVWEAVQAYRLALPGTSEEQVRERLREALHPK